MLTIKCKQCDNENNIKSEFIIKDKTVCPDCKDYITITGDVIDAESFIDLPIDERKELKEIFMFRTNSAHKFESLEKFQEDINKYVSQFFQHFQKINFYDLGSTITEYIIDNHKDLTRYEISTFKQMIAITCVLNQIQSEIEELGDLELPKIIAKLQAREAQ